jgi:hypothetical protein
MRTSLTIDDDVLAVAKGLACRQSKSVGEVISARSRRGLQALVSRSLVRNGVRLLKAQAGAAPVTAERVNRLRDGLP